MKYIFEEEDLVPGLSVESENGNVAMLTTSQQDSRHYLVNLAHNYVTDHTTPELLALFNDNNYKPVKINIERAAL